MLKIILNLLEGAIQIAENLYIIFHLVELVQLIINILFYLMHAINQDVKIIIKKLFILCGIEGLYFVILHVDNVLNNILKVLIILLYV